jgi:hypothetical protein
VARSLSEPVELECPRCGKGFVAVVWRIVDASERPDLRLLILLGRLNRVRCPFCTAEGSFPGPFLYHDAAHQAVLLALPAGSLAEAQVREMADPLVEALHQAIPPEERHPYLWNVQLAGSMAGLAAEIRSWGEGGLALPGGAR